MGRRIAFCAGKSSGFTTIPRKGVLHLFGCTFEDFFSSNHSSTVLEPVCCKKRQKSPNQETGLENKALEEPLNDNKLILNDSEGHSCSFKTNLV